MILSKNNLLFTIRLKIDQKYFKEIKIYDESEISYKLLTFFHKYKITDLKIKEKIKKKIKIFFEKKDPGKICWIKTLKKDFIEEKELFKKEFKNSFLGKIKDKMKKKKKIERNR